MRTTILLASLPIALITALCPGGRADETSSGWRSLPLIKDGKIHPDWAQVGYGGFAGEDDMLRTQPDARGPRLLLHRKEKFGNCEIRVVFKARDAKSNSGVFVRIDDGILKKVDEKHAPARRDKDGKLTRESLATFMEASEEGRGPWFAVHHGYEVQICDEAHAFHRTGSIYSLARSTAPVKKPTEWKTMVIILKGDLVSVEMDDKRIMTFDPAGKDVPKERKWYEPKRE